MSHTDPNGPSQRAWITSNIGWLSLCILAAAWGNLVLPDELRDYWGAAGVFGLASALGLASVAAAKKRATKAANPH
jgi:hypothetical protein